MTNQPIDPRAFNEFKDSLCDGIDTQARQYFSHLNNQDAQLVSSQIIENYELMLNSLIDLGFFRTEASGYVVDLKLELKKMQRKTARGTLSRISKGLYVPSQKCVVRETDLIVEINGEQCLISKQDSFQIANIRPVLEALLKSSSKFTSYVETANVAFRDGMNGTLYKETLDYWDNYEREHALNEKRDEKRVLNCLCRIFGDEFAPFSSLSPHGSLYKVMSFYLHPMGLPAWIESKIKSILVLALVYGQDLKDLGTPTVLRPMVKVLNELQTNPIPLENNQHYDSIRFVATLLCGDNLGMNCFCGLVESFNSDFPCRFCRMPKSKWRFATQEIELLKRTVENYTNDVLINNPKLNGVKHESLFNELIGFHVMKNATFDIMHDEFLGSHIKIILIFLQTIQNKDTFLLGIILERIKNYKWPPSIKDKPIITTDNVEKNYLKISAAMSIYIVLHLPFIVDGLLEEWSDEYKLMIIAKKVLKLLLLDRITPLECKHLSHLISEKHCLYLKLASQLQKKDAHLTPKMHNEVHYATLIQRFGPPKGFWTMRFEAKHQELKNIDLQCKINILKTLFDRYSAKLMALFDSKFLDMPEVSFNLGEKKINSLDILDKYHLVDFPVHFHGKTFKKIENYENRGKKVNHNSIVADILEMNICEMSYEKVEELFYDTEENEVFCVTRELIDLGFRDDFDAQQLKKSDDFLFKSINSVNLTFLKEGNEHRGFIYYEK